MTAWDEYVIAAPPAIDGVAILFPFKDYRDELANLKSVIKNTKQWRKRALVTLRGFVWHQSLGTDSVTGNAKYHMGPNHISDSGLPGLSYTWFIDKPGWVYLCNNLDDRTLSQGDAKQDGDENALYMSCCFGGHFSGPGHEGPETPTLAQIRSGLALWAWCKKRFDFTNNQLFGHYNFSKPTCPGYDLQAIIELVRKDKDWEDNHDEDLSSIYGRQAALIHLAYLPAGAADGAWGRQSKSALVKFQREHNLGADGVWGPRTEAAIRLARPVNPPDDPDE